MGPTSLSRLERGKQPLRDVVVLRRLAEELGIPPELLGIAPGGHGLAGSGSGASAGMPARVRADLDAGGGEGPVRRRELLAGFAGLTAGAALPGRDALAASSGREELARAVEGVLYGTRSVAGQPLPLPALRAAVVAAGRDYQGAGYRRLAAGLPSLITAAAATREAATGADRASAETLLAETYTLASHLLVKVNDDGPALVAADRAVQAAERGDDPLVLAASRRGVAAALRRTGRREAAQALVITAAEAIEPARQASAEHLAVYGSLLCTAAYTAAADGNRSAATDLIGAAVAVAGRLGVDADFRHTSFGPTNVAVYQVGIAQVLGDCGSAIQHARTVHPAALPTSERRGRYWVDVARAYHQWGKPERCLRALLVAERAAPADVRYRPPVHRMTVALLRGPGRLPGLREFAGRIGVRG